MTEQEQQEIRQTIDDLNLFESMLKELEGKMTSESGQTFIKQFVAKVVPTLKQMKAVCLVELGEV